jgi:hypothetical protein
MQEINLSVPLATERQSKKVQKFLKPILGI